MYPPKRFPADLASHGGPGPVPEDSNLWWHGPKWLSHPRAWPVDITSTTIAEILAEAKTVREIFKLATDQEVDGFDALPNKYGLWRVFVNNTRRPPHERKTRPLTTEELSVQRRFWEKRVQQEGVKSKNYENNRSQLNLQLNDQQFLECWGRIQGVYPVYLPETAVYTEKFMEQAHESTLHRGTQLTMAKVQERHWVLRLRQLVKRIMKKCPGCKRF